MELINKDIPRNKSLKQYIGRAGEDFAAGFLTEAGLIIVQRNFRCPKGEIDIIAQERDDLVFIEVRTRSSDYRGWGEESITWLKRQRLQAIAAYYLQQQGYEVWPRIRFDLVALRWQEEIHSCNWLQAIF